MHREKLRRLASGHQLVFFTIVLKHFYASGETAMQWRAPGRQSVIFTMIMQDFYESEETSTAGFHAPANVSGAPKSHSRPNNLAPDLAPATDINSSAVFNPYIALSNTFLSLRLECVVFYMLWATFSYLWGHSKMSGATRNAIPSQLKSYYFVYLNVMSVVGYHQKSRHLPAEITLSIICECDERGSVPPEIRYPLI